MIRSGVLYEPHGITGSNQKARKVEKSKGFVIDVVTFRCDGSNRSRGSGRRAASCVPRLSRSRSDAESLLSLGGGVKILRSCIRVCVRSCGYFSLSDREQSASSDCAVMSSTGPSGLFRRAFRRWNVAFLLTSRDVKATLRSLDFRREQLVKVRGRNTFCRRKVSPSTL